MPFPEIGTPSLVELVIVGGILVLFVRLARKQAPRIERPTLKREEDPEK